MPSNPRVIVCDTDALIEVFATKSITNLQPLRVLKSNYGIQAVVVEEVENELCWNRRYGNRFEPDLRKALANGTLDLLDQKGFANYVPAQLVRVVFDGFSQALLEMGKFTDPGEAATFAAANALNVPAVSNDFTAVKALENNGFQLPVPVLRMFDLLVFGFQIGSLSEAQCDKVRQSLRASGEHIDRAFRGSSFVDGLGSFCPRLLDGGVQAVGTPPAPGPDYRKQILVTKTF